MDTGTGREPRFSDDGQWWWDGQSWLPARSPDRQWHWDGNVWVPAKLGSAPAPLLLGALVMIPLGVVVAGQIASTDPVFFDLWVGLGAFLAASIALWASYQSSENPSAGSGAIAQLWGRAAYAVSITLGGAAGSLIAALLFPSTWRLNHAPWGCLAIASDNRWRIVGRSDRPSRRR
jgi:hypothetical protein